MFNYLRVMYFYLLTDRDYNGRCLITYALCISICRQAEHFRDRPKKISSNRQKDELSSTGAEMRDKHDGVASHPIPPHSQSARSTSCPPPPPNPTASSPPFPRRRHPLYSQPHGTSNMVTTMLERWLCCSHPLIHDAPRPATSARP